MTNKTYETKMTALRTLLIHRTVSHVVVIVNRDVEKDKKEEKKESISIYSSCE